MARKPRGWSAFDALARKIVNVPREAADKVIQKKARLKRRKKR